MDAPWMLASNPASILNQKTTRAGIKKTDSTLENHALREASSSFLKKKNQKTFPGLKCATSDRLGSNG
jgi:hypothetical protein